MSFIRLFGSITLSSVLLLTACGQKPTPASTQISTASASQEIAVAEFSNAQGDTIRVSYFETTDQGQTKMWVRLQGPKQTEHVLPQTAAWAKGASYANADMTWEDLDDRATWTQNGQATSWTRQK